MSKSIIAAVVIPAKGSKPASTMFGILDAELPFRTSKEGEDYANGLSFGKVKAGLLLDRLEADPDGLRAALRDYLAESPAESPAPAPSVPTPRPVVASLPAAPAPAPAAPAPAPKPSVVGEVTYKGRKYRKLLDGTVQFWQGDRKDGKDRWVKYTNGPAIDFAPRGATPPAPLPPVKPAAPAPSVKPPAPSVPTPAPSGKLVIFTTESIVNEDTLVVTLHYADGTASWTAHHMAV